jgi:hypothetical protein
MPVVDLAEWLTESSRQESVWYVKRLAANDTLATGSHQGGPYFPKELLFDLFPELNDTSRLDPDVQIDAYIDSHADHRSARIIWYNGRVLGKGTRNEARITRWGGSASAVLDPESTGSVAVFAFTARTAAPGYELHVWVCNHATEEDVIEDRVGVIEPGHSRVWKPDFSDAAPSGRGNESSDCQLARDEIPAAWRTTFPAAEELVALAIDRRQVDAKRSGQRLISRRACEMQLFRTAEQEFERERLDRGFASVDTMLARSQLIQQRRRIRSEVSLLLQLKAIFEEEGLTEGQQYDFRAETEPGNLPDFVFPSLRDYHDPEFSDAKLRVLIARTTCKTRWKTAQNIAPRAARKHFLSLQEGVSERQFRDMQEAGVVLVVPTPLLKHYPENVRSELVPLQTFIDDVRHLRILA